MSISKDEIKKYIFDPNNPTQCKSYKLLLRIAKKQNTIVYVSSEFILQCYQNEIINEEFNNSLWDKPDDFDNLSPKAKINLFKKNLSEKEYIEHLEKIQINQNKFTYNKIFNKFFDLHTNGFHIDKFKQYDIDLISSKLLFSKDYSFGGYKEYKDTYSFNQVYHGHKILFTNTVEDLYKSDDFYDVSSIVVTTLPQVWFNKESKFWDEEINQNIKPIFLKKIQDVDLLLAVLQNEINKTTSSKTEQNDINTINSIDIKNFYSIKDLKLNNLSDKKEVYILGENGDGKTLLLQAIAVALKGTNKDGQESFRSIKENFTLNINDSKNTIFDGKEKIAYKNLLAYGSSRNNNCSIKEDESGYLTLFNSTLDLKDPQEWLRVLYYKEKDNEKTNISLAQLKQILINLLNKDIDIKIDANKIEFIEKGSVVEFDRLSAGYKSVITIICDILVRLSSNQPYINDTKEFQGVVLIDEVELHLHPKWKYQFISQLRELFPLIQFIVTTHSPTVILGASSEAIFYKIYKENAEVCISNQIQNQGYTNNSLITSSLFDLGTASSKNYDNSNFSDDDYIYDKIHKVISQKIKNDINISEDEILNLINKELDNI